MLEMLINPKKAERHPWELFFIGAFYASISLLIVQWVFGNDPVLSKYSGILIVTFTVIFSMPFIYYTIRLEEKKITPSRGYISLLQEHKKALYAFLFLFVGFVFAYSFWFIVLDSPDNFRAQVETYCLINRPSSFSQCVEQYGIKNSFTTTGAVTSSQRLFLIFTNNLYVSILTLAFSLLFGAGVIFVLAWNASVIAAAVGIFAHSELSQFPLGLFRYLLHGLPEIAAYFIVAIAGGLVSVAVIRHEAGTEKFWEVLHDSLNLLVVALIVLFLAALMEVFITPLFF